MKRGKELWSSLSNYRFDDPTSQSPFSRRLQNENLGWTRKYTLRVLEEYKKFIFLGCHHRTTVSPSEDVDQAWHLHMIYTRDYWEDFCKNVLEKNFHHGPSRGKNDDEKYERVYQQTLDLYKETFGYDPPSDIWPPVEKRFGYRNFKRIDVDKHWVIPVDDTRALFRVLGISLRRKLQKLK
jgi:hypothetical protein